MLQDFNEVIVIDSMTKPDSDAQLFEWSIMRVYKEEAYKLKTNALKTNSKQYIPKTKDKLYFYPGCNVPRYKVREWGKKNKITVTIKYESATAKFGCEQSVSSCISYETFIKTTKVGYIQWLNNNYDCTKQSIKQLIVKLNNSGNNYVYLHRYGPKSLQQFNEIIHAYGHNAGKIHGWAKLANLKTGIKDHDAKIDGYYRGAYLTENNYNILTSLLSAPDIYSQEEIIGLINEDAAIIDQNMYNRLRDMFNSKTSADHTMAIEILANCNISPSLHHVMLLIKEFNTLLYSMAESKHVNFKSLLEYIDVNRGSMGSITDDKMVQCLMDKNVLSMEIVRELAEGVKNLWKNDHDSSHFKIQTITVSEEVKQYFKIREDQQKVETQLT